MRYPGRNGYCETCARALRKASAPKKEKKPQRISKTADPERQKIYLAIREMWLVMQINCEVCGHRTPTDVHHKSGKQGDLLYDIRKWLAVCRPCHQRLHDHDAEAKKNGYSLSRLAKDEPTV